MLRSISRVRPATKPLVRTLSNTPASSGGISTSKAEALTPTAGNPELKKWVRPLEPGALPAYDEALAYIELDAANKRAELARRCRVRDDEGRQWSTEQLEQLEVESEINLPEVRWNFKQGDSMWSPLLCVAAWCLFYLFGFSVDLSKPVYRYLFNQRWRKMGRLDRLVRNFI